MPALQQQKLLLVGSSSLPYDEKLKSSEFNDDPLWLIKIRLRSQNFVGQDLFEMTERWRMEIKQMVRATRLAA
jgi:hypothetical protein